MAGNRLHSCGLLRGGFPLLLRGGGRGSAACVRMRRHAAWDVGFTWALRSAKMPYSHEFHGGHIRNPYMEQRLGAWQQLTSKFTDPATSSCGVGVAGPTNSRPLFLLLTAKTRSAMEEAAENFIRNERRRLYAIYRPSPSGDDSLMPSPYDYVCVLQRLSACGMGVTSKIVYLILVELLKKPLHPSQAGTEWDLPEDAAVNVQAKALEAVMSGLVGCDALAFAQSCLMPPLSSTTGTDVSRHSGEMVLLHAIHRQLKGSDVNPTPLGVNGGSIDSRLMVTPFVVAAVAAALIRCNTNTEKQQAFELLQLASIARLRGLNVFDENVAERCAEAAALIGDAETVTRIIFILYRARGVLGQLVSSENAAGENADDGVINIESRGGGSLWDRVFLGLGLPASAEKRTEGDGDAAFHRATVRLLKSVIHAALRRPNSTDSREESLTAIREAVRLFDSLRMGCDWDGTASMAVELLTQMGVETRRYLDHEPHDGDMEPLFYLHRETLRVTIVLWDALPSRPSAYQHSVYAACAVLAMKCYLLEVTISTENGMTVPVLAVPFLSSRIKQLDYLVAAITATLDLFDSMSPECQVQQMHLAMTFSAAAVAISSVRPNDGCIIERIFSRLKELFLRAGLLTTNPTDMMSRFSSLGDQGTVCGALWLYMVLSAGLFPVLSGEEEKTHAGEVLGEGMDKWVKSALPIHRMLLWELLSTPVYHAYFSLMPSLLNLMVSAVGLVVDNARTSPERRSEAVAMLRFLYGQRWCDSVADATARTIADRLLSSLLQFGVTTASATDIAEKCLSDLGLNVASEEVILVIGASGIQNARGTKRDLLEILREMASSCETAGGSLHVGPSGVFTRRLILTLDAVILLVELSSRSGNGKCIDEGALEVLSWLQQCPPLDPLFHQVLAMTPNSCVSSLSVEMTRERRYSVRGQEFRDGVGESCAIALALADRIKNPAQASRVAVFLWDNDDEDDAGDEAGRHTGAKTRHALLLRHGVRSLSQRRAQVQRAKADVMEILRASFPLGSSSARHRRDQKKTCVKSSFERRGVVSSPSQIP
ncbi:hypothetical protein MOQ_004590 [Trypanosoma cruzi marinkellei]|uniref:Uncharacterized protein n=1 Tax=Trypanosoma cruzi marinkellei TaxID=85056 RepID=K2M958_TRYCR|nr:hypothetical protein MOQ_004590 [Trypanosoma cruzi marinkellei]